VNDTALVRRHWLQCQGSSLAPYAVGGAHGDPTKGLLATVTVVFDVDDDPTAARQLFGKASVEDKLERSEGLTMPTNEQTNVIAGDVEMDIRGASFPLDRAHGHDVRELEQV